MSLIATNTNPSGYGVNSLCHVGGYVYAYMYQYGIAKYDTSGALVSTLQNATVTMETQMSTHVASKNTIYTPEYGNHVATYNLSTNTYTDRAFNPTGGIWALATDGSYFYVAVGGEYGKINKLDLSFNMITVGFIPANTSNSGAATGISGSKSMVCDGSYLYHGDSYAVRRINMATKVVDKNWISGLAIQDPILEIQSNYLYIPDSNGSSSQSQLIKVYELATGLYVQTINYRMVDPSGVTSPTAITTDGTNLYTINISNPGTGIISHLYKTAPANAVGNAPVITRVGSSLGTSNSSIEITFNRSGTYPLPITTYYSLDNGGTYINAGSAKSPLLITGLSDQSYNVLVKVNSASGNTAASNVVAKSSFVPGLMIATTSPPGYAVASLCYAGGYVYAYMFTYGIAKYDTSGTLVSTLYGPINLENQMSTYIAARNTIYTPVHGTMISTYNLSTNTYTENAFYPAEGPYTLATDGSYLYVGVNGGTGKINKCDFSMNVITAGFISANTVTTGAGSGSGSKSMVCDGSYLYHGDYYGVRRINIATKVVDKNWISGLTIQDPILAIQSNYLYVAEQNNNSQTNLIKVYELATGLYVQTINYRMVDPSSNVSPSSITTDGTNLYTINSSNPGSGTISHLYKTTPANTVGNAPVISSVPALNRNGLAINFTRSGAYPVPTTSYYSVDNGATYVNVNSVTSPIFITNLADQSCNVLLKVNSPSGNTAASNMVTARIATGITTVFYARPQTDNFPAALIFINGTLYTFDGQYQYYKYPNYPSYAGRTSFTSPNYLGILGGKTIGYSSSKNTIYYVYNYDVGSYNLTTDTLNTSFITRPLNCTIKDIVFTGTYFYCLTNNNGANSKIGKYDASGNVITLDYYTGLHVGAELLTYDGSRYLYYSWQTQGTTQQNIGKLDTQSVNNIQNFLTGVIATGGYGVSRVYAEPTGTYIYSNTDLSGNGITRMNKYDATGGTASFVSSTAFIMPGTTNTYQIGNNFIYNNGYFYIPGNDALYEMAINTAVNNPPSISSITSIVNGLIINYSASTGGAPPPLDYYYSLDNGSTYVDTNSVVSPITVTGLNSLNYNVVIKSRNYSGNTSASSTVVASPYLIGNPPVINRVDQVGANGIAIYCTPGTGGNPAPDSYYYSLDNGATYIDASSASSPITITGLSNQLCQVLLKSRNIAGTTGASNLVYQTSQPSPLFTYYIPYSYQIGVYLAGSGTVVIDWGDNSLNVVTINGTPQQFLHTYAAAATFQVRLMGTGITRLGGPSPMTGIGAMAVVNTFGTSSAITDLSGLFAGTGTSPTLPSTLPPTVTNLSSLFQNAIVNANSNVSVWDVSNVSIMDNMFNGATIGANISLANWRLKSLTSAVSMFTGSNLNTATDNMLIGWATQTPLQSNVSLGLNTYSGRSKSARDVLTGSYGWTIAGASVNYSLIYKNVTDRYTFTYTNPVTTPVAGRTYSLYSNTNQQLIASRKAEAGDASYGFSNIATFPAGIQTLTVFDNSTNSVVDSVAFDTSSTIFTYSIPSAGSPVGVWLAGSGSALINWGDGSANNVSLTGTTTEFLHTFSASGEYFVDINGAGITQIGQGVTAYSIMTGIGYMTSVVSFGASPITSLAGMFRSAANPGLPPSIPRTATDFAQLFYGGAINDPNINLWDVSGVTNGLQTFNVTTFNNAAITLSNWNVKSIQQTQWMFAGSNFNQDIGGWTFENWAAGFLMFDGAASFNQDLSRWNLTKMQGAGSMFRGSAMSTVNIEKLLAAWSKQTLLYRNVELGVGRYSARSKSDRDVFTNTYGWTIVGTQVSYPLTYNFSTNVFKCTYTGTSSPVAGHAYSICSDLSATPLATYTAQAGDASFGFTDISAIPVGAKTLVFKDTTNSTVVDTVNLDTTLPTLTYSIPSAGTQIGVFVGGSGSAIINWGDGSYNSVSLTSPVSEYLHTYASAGQYLVDISGAGLVNLGTQGTNFYGNNRMTGIQYLNAVVSFGSSTVSLKGSLTYSSGVYIPPNIPSTVTNIGLMFGYNSSIHPNVGLWDVSGVSTANQMFYNCSNTNNINLTNWNVKSLRYAAAMFRGSDFNQNIGIWNCKLVETYEMFLNCSNFNQDLSNWDVSGMTHSMNMFTNATKFNQDLSKWNVNSLISADQMFTGSGMSTANIDNLINAWSTDAIQPSVTLGLSNYSSYSRIARDILINYYAWQFTGNLVTYKLFYRNDGNPGYTFTYSNALAVPTAGRTYSLYGDSSQNAVATYTAQVGDSSYVFNIPAFPNGEPRLLSLFDNYSQTIFDSVNPKLPFASFTYSIPSASTQIGIYLGGSGSVTIDWGDVSLNIVSLSSTPTEYLHRYSSSGTFVVQISGNGITSFGPGVDSSNPMTGIQYLTAIDSFGTRNSETSLAGMLKNSVNVSVPAGIPSAVTNLGEMFVNATIRDPNVNLWDVSNVQIARQTFSNTVFGNARVCVSHWNTKNLLDASGMFYNSPTFNQNLSRWNVGNLTNGTRMFTGSGMTTANVDKTIAVWSSQSVQQNVPLHLTNYSYRSKQARDVLTNAYGWQITGSQSTYALTYDSSAGYRFAYANPALNPVAGHTYSLYGVIGHAALSTYTELSTYTASVGDASYVFQSISGFPAGITTLAIMDSSSIVDAIVFETTSVIYTYSIPSASTQIGVYLGGSGTVTITWGDGSANDVSLTSTPSQFLHTYGSSGSFTVDISGSAITQLGPGIDVATTGIQYLTSVASFGTSPLTSLAGLLRGSVNVGVPNKLPVTVTRVDQLFYGATLGDIDINVWDVSNVQIATQLFSTAVFGNAGIRLGGWNPKNLSDASGMFANSTTFDQDLSTWNVANLTVASSMFSGSGMTAANIDKTLVGWSALSLRSNVPLGLLTAYSYRSKPARDILTGSYGWTMEGTSVNYSLIYKNVTDRYTFTYTNPVTPPVAGRTYSLYSNANQQLIASRTAQAGDASYGFSNIANLGAGIRSLTVFDNSANSVVDSVVFDTSLVIITYSIPSAGNQIGVWLKGSGSALITWGDGSANTVSLTGTVTEVLHTFSASGRYFVDVGGSGITQIGQGVTGSSVMTGIGYMTSVASFGSSPITSLAGIFRSSTNVGLPPSFPSTVTNLGQFFFGATINDPNINLWDVSGVTFGQQIFNVTTFNNPAINITGWNVKSLANTFLMFSGSNFNQDIGGWNFTNLVQCNQMFVGASSFNQDLSRWNVSKVAVAENMFTGSAMTTSNTDNLLAAWSKQTLWSNTTLGLNRYSVYSQGAINKMTSTYGWTITGSLVNYTPSYTNASYVPQITFKYSNAATNPTAGRTYALRDTVTQSQFATYVAQSGDVSYNFNANLRVGGILTLSIVDTTTSTLVDIVNFSAYTVCFKEDSKILCLADQQEKYVAVQDLRKGDLVKTVLHGYVPIHMIGKKQIHHTAKTERIKDQLYRCAKEQYPELLEDLVITGCHSILVDNFKDEEQLKKAIEVNDGRLFKTDDRYRLPACADDRTTVYENKGVHTIYHIALDNESYYGNYGVYANGLLVETCSKRFLNELANMEIL